MKKLHLDILGLSEVIWLGAGKIKSGMLRIRYSSVTKHVEVVAFILDPVQREMVKRF